MLRGVLSRWPARRVTVAAYGAVGNGVVDDTAAIQRAIDGAGDVPLEFPPGDYLVSDTLYVDDSRATGGNTRVARKWIGAGAFNAPLSVESGVRTQHTRLKLTKVSGTCIDVLGQGFSAEGIFFDGDAADGATTLKLYRSDTFEDIDAYFRGCRFRNGLRGIHIVGRGLDVQGCAFETMNYPIYLDFPASIDSDSSFGQQTDSAYRAITIKGNRFHSIDQACIANLGSQASQLVNLDVIGNHCDGGSVLRFWDGNLGRLASIVGNKVSALKASGSGMRVPGGNDFTITGNTFSGYIDSIATDTDRPNYLLEFTGSVGRFSITGNVFQNCVLRAIAANASANFDQGAVVGNVFYDFAGDPGNAVRPAIYVTGNMTDTVISGNWFGQPTGRTYSTELVRCDGTVGRSKVVGNVFNTTRHRIHNNVAFGGEPGGTITSTATDYTTTPADSIIRVTSTASARTITLSTTRLEPGHEFLIKDTSGGAGTNNITISGVNTDGSASVVINTNYGYARLRYNGTTFDRVG
ncbi:MAG: hypothetical protein KGR68_09155 [Betaproteobacteria bacterium]|nr:hypothetical protein [Betaproteobacteria bacterium]